MDCSSFPPWEMAVVHVRSRQPKRLFYVSLLAVARWTNAYDEPDGNGWTMTDD
jgi:hypothetical protein